MVKAIRNILFIFSLFHGIALHAQNAGNRGVEDLKQALLRTSGDEARLRLMMNIGTGYYKKNNDSSLLYSTRSFALAKKTGNDSMAMESAEIIANVLRKFSKHDSARLYFNIALQYSRNLNYKLKQIDYLLDIGYILNEKGQYHLSNDIFREAVPIAVELHNREKEAFIYESIASDFVMTGDFAQALDLALYSNKIWDSLKKPLKVAENYNNVIIIYSKQKKYKEALKYALINDSLYTALKEDAGKFANGINIGIIYKNMGDYDQAIRIYNTGLEQSKDDTFAQMIIYSNLGVAFAGKRSFDKAEQCFLMSGALNTRFFHNVTIDIENYMEMVKANLEVKHLDTALYYAKLSEKIAAENHIDYENRKKCITILSDVYAAMGDMGNAYKYSKKSAELQDSIFQTQQLRSVAEAETRFDLAGKNKELAVLSKENELQKVKSQRQAIGLGLGALIVLIIVIGYRRTLRKNALLSEQKKIIDEQMHQLETAAKMKSKFLANISHELRTPVTLLTGMLELIKDKKDAVAAGYKEKMNVAYSNSVKLQKMIEELLDLSKAEKEINELKREQKEPGPLLRRIVYAFETYMEKELLTLVYEEDNMDGVYISVDEDKFEKIINNLVYNAIKFNRKNGWVKVSTHLSADKRSVIMAVSDSGGGISAADLPHVFERFYRGHAPNTKTEGAGIGLSLVKEFTLLLGGTVTVTSKPGEGAIFTLQFPVVDHVPAEVETTADITNEPAESWEQFSDLQTVLIVEDNTEMRYYLKEILGHKVNLAEATNGAEALRWLANNNQPDLIISDIMMPEMDGREFIRQIKATDAYKQIPVITLTALADTDSQLSMLRMGIDDYIVKPFNADELRIRVYNLLRNYGERKQFNLQPKEPDDVPADSKEAETFRNKITEYVLARMKNDSVSVYDLAYELSLSERQLYRLAKSLTGCTPAQLIKEVRLQKAYELLVSGDIYKLDDVSRRVGFEKTSYFSQQFFERFGKRATEFL